MSERLFIRLFALVLFCGGMAFAFVLPPFQVPDEIAHYQRSFELSQGSCNPPDQLKWPASYNTDAPVFHAFLENDELVHQHLLGSVARASFSFFVKSDADTPLQISALSHYEDVYPCPLYAPGALALALVRPFHPSLTASLLVVRLITLFICGSCFVFGLRLMPFGKEAYAFAALLPMMLEQLASASEDAMVFSLAYLAIAYFLRLIFVGRDTLLRRNDFFAIVLLCALLALAKIDALLILLIFFIPTARFGNVPRRFGLIVSGCVVAVASFATSPLFAHKTWHTFAQIAAPKGTDPAVNGAFAFAHPGAMIHALYLTLKTMGFEYLTEIIGTFGWLACRLPKQIVVFAIVISVIVGLRTDFPALASRLRASLLAIAALAVCAIFYSLYLVNESTTTFPALLAGTAQLAGVQGRYALPFVPLAVLALGRAGPGERRYDRFLVIFVAIVLIVASMRAISALYY